MQCFEFETFVVFCCSDEINDLTDQLGESGRRVMEMEKAYKRLEMEKDQVKQLNVSLLERKVVTVRKFASVSCGF